MQIRQAAFPGQPLFLRAALDWYCRFLAFCVTAYQACELGVQSRQRRCADGTIELPLNPLLDDISVRQELYPVRSEIHQPSACVVRVQTALDHAVAYQSIYQLLHRLLGQS